MEYIWGIIILLYLIATHLVAQYQGRKRKIGYGNSVLVSLLFSPVIGLIVTLLSKPVKHAES